MTWRNVKQCCANSLFLSHLLKQHWHFICLVSYAILSLISKKRPHCLSLETKTRVMKEMWAQTPLSKVSLPKLSFPLTFPPTSYFYYAPLPLPLIPTFHSPSSSFTVKPSLLSNDTHNLPHTVTHLFSFPLLNSQPSSTLSFPLFLYSFLADSLRILIFLLLKF